MMMQLTRRARPIVCACVVLVLVLCAWKTDPLGHPIPMESENSVASVDVVRSGDLAPPVDFPQKALFSLSRFYVPPCRERTIFVAFVLMEEAWGSSFMRGRTIVQALRAPDFEDIEARNFTWKRLDDAPGHRLWDLCVLVKGKPLWMDSVRKHCKKVAFDGVDMNMEEKAAMATLKGVDYVIATNSIEVLSYVSKHRPRESVWIIPHHHDNVHNVHKENPEKAVTTVGWHGNFLNNRMAEQDRKRVEAHCRHRGVVWEEIPTNQSVSDDTFRLLTSLDILVLFPPHDRGIPKAKTPLYNRDVILHKPVTRFILFLSLGVPTIAYPYASYLEAAAMAYYPAFASSVPELLQWIDMLVESEEARRTLSMLGISLAKAYSLDNIAHRYADTFRRALCRDNA